MTEKRKLLVIEEYGYRSYGGDLTSLEVEDLIEWWTNLNSVLGMFFYAPTNFPYSIKEFPPSLQYSPEDFTVRMHCHEDGDSHLSVQDLNTKEWTTYRHKGYVEMGEEADIT